MPYHNSAAEHVFGTIGTICWTGQLIPQLWKSWREKSTEGLSHWLVLLWGLSCAFQGVYCILQNINIPLIVQPQVFGFLSLLSWGQCLYYGSKRTRKFSILLMGTVMVVCGSLETVFVFVLRPSHDRGQHTATDFFGIFASVLISVALFPQYWEIYKHKEVVGISLVFISIDILGGIFNDLSLVFKEEFDIIAAVCYSLVVVLDGVILIAAMILNPLARGRRRREAEMAALEDTTIPSTPCELESGLATPATSITAEKNDSSPRTKPWAPATFELPERGRSGEFDEKEHGSEKSSLGTRRDTLGI
ncbi:PQ loop repeat-domain-containing protein [Crucibulum laeve]|uniref:PQ loop repeat-domain-containing protein n=1 Tax=Crucibulum laeve TaxID=68775 RepID=A0A5C3M3G4_9AGAR|nr:PQ loop repeat-domain-containing protein [Crucibulum laeve]